MPFTTIRNVVEVSEKNLEIYQDVIENAN